MSIAWYQLIEPVNWGTSSTLCVQDSEAGHGHTPRQGGVEKGPSYARLLDLHHFQPYPKSRHVDDDSAIGTQAILAGNHGVSNNDEDYSKVNDAVVNVPSDNGLYK